MISRQVLLRLLGALAVLLVAFAVLTGFQQLFAALGDAQAALALRWTAMACLMAALGDVVLLVAALTLRALEQDDRGDGGGSS